jgi:hypothetical protein
VKLAGAQQAGAKRYNNKQQTNQRRTSRPGDGEDVAPTVEQRTTQDLRQLHRLNQAKSNLRIAETLS